MSRNTNDYFIGTQTSCPLPSKNKRKPPDIPDFLNDLIQFVETEDPVLISRFINRIFSWFLEDGKKKSADDIHDIFKNKIEQCQHVLQNTLDISRLEAIFILLKMLGVAMNEEVRDEGDTAMALLASFTEIAKAKFPEKFLLGGVGDRFERSVEELIGNCFGRVSIFINLLSQEIYSVIERRKNLKTNFQKGFLETGRQPIFEQMVYSLMEQIFSEEFVLKSRLVQEVEASGLKPFIPPSDISPEQKIEADPNSPSAPLTVAPVVQQQSRIKKQIKLFLKKYKALPKRYKILALVGVLFGIAAIVFGVLCPPSLVVTGSVAAGTVAYSGGGAVVLATTGVHVMHAGKRKLRATSFRFFSENPSHTPKEKQQNGRSAASFQG